MKKETVLNKLIVSASLIYALALLCVAFFFPVRERTAKTYEYSFIPFRNIITQIKSPAQYNTPDYWFMFTVSLAGNVIMFIPYGCFAALLFPRQKQLTIFFYGLITSVCIELTQLLFRLGVCDIDDVILNCIGTLTGIWIAGSLRKLKISNHEPGIYS